MRPFAASSIVSMHPGYGIHNLGHWNALHRPGTIGAHIQAIVGYNQVPNIRQHTSEASNKAFAMYINNGNATLAAHARYQDIATLWRKHCATQGITTTIIAINLTIQWQIKAQPMVYDHIGALAPHLGTWIGDVYQPHRIVPPMSDSYNIVPWRHSHHLG